MSQKNGESARTLTKWVRNTGLVFSTSLIAMTGLVGSASAYGACDPCSIDCCSEMPDFQIYADFLYWQRHVEGEGYAATNFLIANDSESPGQVYSGGCDFTPGFRIGGVVDLGCCDWNFFAQYTWLNPSYTEKAEAGDRTLVGFFRPNVDVALTSASLKHDDHFNNLDFGMGRSFYVNDCFIFQPHVGFKATWQELNKTTEYNFITDSDGTTVRYLNKIDFNGIGLRAGFDASWKFNQCFSLVGGMAISAVYSDMDISHKVEASTVVANAITETVTLQSNVATNCALIPVAELLLGVRWDSRVLDCYDVFVFVGWENQVWFNLNQFANDSFGAPVTVLPPVNPGVALNPAANPVSGNVTMQGLTVRLGFGF